MSELDTYLSAVAADNDVTLQVRPSGTVRVRGNRKQRILKGLDGSEERIDLDTGTPECFLFLNWNIRDKTTTQTVLGFWYDSGKGNGKTKTFYYEHVDDSTYTLTVRFDSDIEHEIREGKKRGVVNSVFKVVGKHP